MHSCLKDEWYGNSLECFKLLMKIYSCLDSLSIIFVQVQNRKSEGVLFLFNITLPLISCGFRYGKNLIGNRIQKKNVHFLDAVKERTLASCHCCFGVTANLGMNSCCYSEKFRQYFGRLYSGKIKKKMEKKAN